MHLSAAIASEPAHARGSAGGDMTPDSTPDSGVRLASLQRDNCGQTSRRSFAPVRSIHKTLVPPRRSHPLREAGSGVPFAAVPGHS